MATTTILLHLAVCCLLSAATSPRSCFLCFTHDMHSHCKTAVALLNNDNVSPSRLLPSSASPCTASAFALAAEQNIVGVCDHGTL